MSLLRSDKDLLTMEITSADKSFLYIITGEGVDLRNIRIVDSLTVRVRCLQADLERVKYIADKHGASIKVIKSPVIVFTQILRRPVLLISIVLFAVLVTFLPARVLFVRVEGNVSVPDNLILEEADRCGIRFGASRRQVRSEKMKNALLGALPRLQWAGINTSGCVATISVREKSVEDQTEPKVGIGSIIAQIDGIIESCTVLNGTALCQVGQAVTAGETLVSGYTDCGIAIKGVRAEADITAQTIRTISAVSPVPTVIRGKQTHAETKYALRIGKKLINFSKDSGISDTSCVKMYSEYYLTLPGGFQLPVAIVSQRCIYYDRVQKWTPDWDQWIAEECEKYLLACIQAGQIITADTQIEYDTGSCCFYGKYVCLENIGQFVNEEIINHDG